MLWQLQEALSPLLPRKKISPYIYYYLSYSGMAVLTRFVGGRLADRLGELRIIPYAMILTGQAFFSSVS